MGQFVIQGGNKLKGEIEVSGSKNSVLPILSATLLIKGISVIKNCPEISDVKKTLEILEFIGCDVDFKNNVVVIDSTNAVNKSINDKFSKHMRSSITFMGSLLSRFNEVKIGYPGGCVIGKRPIDLHLEAFSKMGVCFNECDGYINANKICNKKSEIKLNFPSVGATENIMIMACISDCETVIYNCAKEPEIVDLQNFLNKAGAKIKGAGFDTIYIEGVKKLNSVEYTVLSDRIEAGTFMCAVACAGGEVFIKNAIYSNMRKTISNLIAIGCDINEYKNGIYIKRDKNIKPLSIVMTKAYPGFPTDMQPQFTSVLTLAKGTSIIIETIFESRFKHINELCNMGANISVNKNVATIKGVNALKGSVVNCTDLRCGASLIIAGLSAEGETIIKNTSYVERGYCNIEKKLSNIGANIKLLA